MSKIYEALLRAELDRAEIDRAQIDRAQIDRPQTDRAETNGSGDHAQPPPVATSGAILASLTQSTSSTPLESTSLGETSVPPEALAAFDAAQPVIAHEQIRVLEWNPAYKRLPALLERGSEVEQFRSLRSRMQEFRDLNKLKTVMITSGLPQEGKSFIAMNLAVAFARHKKSRVLLIDGDMRRSSLHKILGCPNEHGLTEYLGGECSLKEIMQRGKAKDGSQQLHPGLASLTFIAGGADAKNAADLSGNSRFRELIAAATPIFDWIIVDTPPVNLVADGVNLARSCDGILLVTRGGVTKYEVAQRALAELKAAKVLGVVLNAVVSPPKTGGYYGYDGYDPATSDQG